MRRYQIKIGEKKNCLFDISRNFFLISVEVFYKIISLTDNSNNEFIDPKYYKNELHEQLSWNTIHNTYSK